MTAIPRLLFINPNTTAEVTQLVASHVQRTLQGRAELVVATGRFGCAYISSEACHAIASHVALDCYA